MHTSREGDMKVEAETGVMWTQAKEHLQPPEAERGKEWILAQSTQRERGNTNIFTLVQ